MQQEICSKPVFKMPLPLADAASTEGEIALRLSARTNSKYAQYQIANAGSLLGMLDYFAAKPGEVWGKRFLDLGCARENPDSEHDNGNRKIRTCSYDPWLCRYLYEAGAVVVGIDVREQKDERFFSYQMDLSKVGELSFIPDKSFDIVVCIHVIDFFARSGSQARLRLKNTTSVKDIRQMEGELLEQARRILVEGGQFLINIGSSYGVLEKQDGRFARLF